MKETGFHMFVEVLSSCVPIEIVDDFSERFVKILDTNKANGINFFFSALKDRKVRWIRKDLFFDLLKSRRIGIVNFQNLSQTVKRPWRLLFSSLFSENHGFERPKFVIVKITGESSSF